jgi:NADH-quinone oxidoreductase subunit G
MADLVNVTIDDIKVQVPAGTLVIDAAKAGGIDIPIFCSHPKLDPLGACRMCLVEFPGPRGSRLDTACTVRVSEGMTVVTKSEAVEQAREAVLAFILINHPLDCPICDKGGECPLQDNTMEYGPGVSKFVEVKRRKQKHYPISDLIMLDQERCILCWRCIRYLEEWEDKPQIGLFERGGETIIDVFPGRPVDAKTSGSIIDICPVGALTNRVARFRYRPWELKKTPSVCTHCPVGCNLRLDERAHTLRRIVARENMAVNDEWICDKGRFLHQHVDHPQRLSQPLVRENGELRQATWDEAITRIVDTLERIAEQHGANATGAIAGGRVSNESGYLLQKFFRQFVGTNNVDFAEGASVAALPTGMPAITDVAKSDVIVLVGFDPTEATPVLDLHIKRAVRRQGARLIIINPRRIEAARYVNDPRGPAGAYIPTRPGDEALALSELAAAVQVRKAALAAAAQKQERGGRPQQAPQAAGQKAIAMTRVARSDIDGAAEILASAKSPLFIYGPDAARGPRGRLALTALSNIAMAVSHGDKLAYVGHEANGQGLRDMGVVANALPGHSSVSDAAARERLGKLWGVQPPAEPGASYQDMLDGKVRALYVMEADPAVSPAAAEALKKLDFVVVQDLFLTETAKLAHVVLPATSWAESDGTYTNLERRIQRGPDGIDSIEGCLPGWAILTRMADRWIASQSHAAPADAAPDWKRKKRARADTKGGSAQKPWNYPDSHTVLDEISRAAPIYTGMRWESLTDQGQQWPATGLARPNRRFEPVEVQPLPAVEQGRFALVSGPLLWDGGVLMQHSAAQLQGRIAGSFIALNPADLSSVDVPEGHGVTVTSDRGSVTAVLQADDCVQPGTAWMPYGLAGQPAETLGAGRGEPVSVTITRAYASLE